MRPPGAETAITLLTWFDTMTPGSCNGTVIESDDLDSDVEQLRERSVAIGGEIQQATCGRFVTIDDPMANGPVLQETADTAT